ncbi:MAG: Quinone oxidoreductase 1 [Verrucomicrobiae bacterium]|nr:Quinone oxidoreductase 1 [Verrucomicrobiae bacterium]
MWSRVYRSRAQMQRGLALAPRPPIPYDTNMQAIRVHQFGPTAVLKLETVPDLAPTASQILVRIHAVGVNPVETYIRSGNYGALPPLPYTPGTDAAGITADGHRVYLSGSLTGTYAEYALCEPRHVHPLPDNISFAQGAALNIPYATAYRALFLKARIAPGETVLIHGASGGVGLAAVQFAVAQGCRVIGTAGSDRGLALVRAQGAHQVLDHRQPDYLTGIAADVILEMLANHNLARDFAALANRGRIVIIGNRGSIEINPREIMRREAVVTGVLVFTATPAELAEMHTAIATGLTNGSLRPVIAHEFPLSAAPQAHEAVMQPGAAGKIVLVPQLQ